MSEILVKCASCEQFLVHKKGKIKIIKNEEEAKLYASVLKQLIVVNDILCQPCRLSIYRNKNKKMMMITLK